MSTQMTNSLTLVDSWLQNHSPSQFESLRPPASEPDLAILRGEGADRDELITLLRVHDGCDSDRRFFLFPNYGLLSANEIVAQMHSNQELRFGLGAIPFAIGASGNFLALDMEDSGRVLLFDVWLGLEGERAYRSLPSLIDDLANSLTTGSPLRYLHSRTKRVPVCVDQELRWEIDPT